MTLCSIARSRSSRSYGGGRRRKRPEVPREITVEIVLELLALLGADLGIDGEAILCRVARTHRPSSLLLWTNSFLESRSAAMAVGFWPGLTEAYYLDDESDGSDHFDDGIRSHHARSFGIFPQSLYYRGPFMPLLQTDFRNGVSVLNRLLNHAARVRVRTLDRLGPIRLPFEDNAVCNDAELEITGTRQRYVGDGHVWRWYRGAGVGPYPCMSALQALERVCDQLIKAAAPIPTLVSILLHGCENLAMVGLVVGLLVRHLENTGRLLDLYLAEPIIWRHEFTRTMDEMSGFAAGSEGLVKPERRKWSLREVAGCMVLRADEERAAQLCAVGEKLVANARRDIESPCDGDITDPGANEGDTTEQQLAVVRAWANSLAQLEHISRG